jgi:ribosome-binding factor A
MQNFQALSKYSIVAQELSIFTPRSARSRVNSGLLSITKVRISPDLRNALFFSACTHRRLR